MSKFKTGDKVLCITDQYESVSSLDPIEKDRTYTVSKSNNSDSFNLEEFPNSELEFMEYAFELAYKKEFNNKLNFLLTE